MTLVDARRTGMRSALRARRKAFVTGLTPAEYNLSFRVLPSPVAKLLAPGARIALYEPVGQEAPTGALGWFLHERGWPLCLPRLAGEDAHIMDFADWSPEQALVPGPRRIPQPAATARSVTPDVIIAPLVGFDSRLNRLGQGGGHYDRAFEHLPDALRIGLAWSVQQVDHIPVEPWDVPLHLVITEQHVLEPEDY